MTDPNETPSAEIEKAARACADAIEGSEDGWRRVVGILGALMRARDAAIFDGHGRCLEESAASRERERALESKLHDARNDNHPYCVDIVQAEQRERAARTEAYRKAADAVRAAQSDIDGADLAPWSTARNILAAIERLIAEEGK